MDGEAKDVVFDANLVGPLEDLQSSLYNTLEGLESLKARLDKLKSKSMISVEMYEYIVNGSDELFNSEDV